MLDPNNHRGSFGEAYVRVLAAAAGLTVYKDELDRDGIDLGVRMPAPGPGFARAVEMQIKTTASPSWGAGCLTFRGLDRKSFNRLAGDRFQVARYLVVVVVPRDTDRFSDMFTSGLLLRTIGYVTSLRDRTLFADEQGRAGTTVRLPLANVLTPDSLRRLVELDPVVAR
ncbi:MULTISPECIES: DUF4365 domain-containing protein [unclassified Pseudonocardia]|uniref:DUF4365 domain-containing protein n=1 Tax=unclassified Pseudonocardia TaxID=2619320 RepID=UPI00094B560E|nr:MULTISPECIES: DUF4365 domain-containing protein [unclassified Pseudonocardia]OLM29651.1 hypothetical protein Ae717Ps2_0544 [Pseudonocardia sp. Ae717_Ps2]